MSNTDQIPIEEQENYWDMWQDERSINSWALRRSGLMIEMLKSLDLSSPKIIDFGCGNGWFCERLAKFGSVTGIDLSRKNMEQASERWPHIEFIGADIFEHPLPDKHFDVVISQQVIAHVEDQGEYVRRCSRMLRDGGYIVLSTNNKLVMDRLGDEYVDDKSLGHMENWLSHRELKNLLSRQFEIVDYRSIIPRGHHGFLRFVNSQRLNNLLQTFLPSGALDRVKEAMGIGYVNVVLGRKRPE